MTYTRDDQIRHLAGAYEDCGNSEGFAMQCALREIECAEIRAAAPLRARIETLEALIKGVCDMEVSISSHALRRLIRNLRVAAESSDKR